MHLGSGIGGCNFSPALVGRVRVQVSGDRRFPPRSQSLRDWLGTMKRMKKAVLNKAEGRAAHKFQFELTPTAVGALDRVL